MNAICRGHIFQYSHQPRTRHARKTFSFCQTVYNYPVLREALNVMSQPPSADQDSGNGQSGPPGGARQLPLLLMRTVMVSVTTFPELKNFVATVVLPRLVQQKVGAWACLCFGARNDMCDFFFFQVHRARAISRVFSICFFPYILLGYVDINHHCWMECFDSPWGSVHVGCAAINPSINRANHCVG